MPTAKKTATKSTSTTSTAKKSEPTRGSGSFSAAEKAAMRERAAEARAEKRTASAQKKAQEAAEALAKAIDALSGVDREVADLVRDVVAEVAPELEPRTYYGMPAWARDGAVLVFLQPATKFDTRYSTLGFNDNAALDETAMWPTAFALTKATPAVRKQVKALVQKAID